MTRPSWLGRAVRNQHRHAVEQASHRWRGGRRDDSGRTRRKILISTQAKTPARGVRELDVFVDDVLVYRGVLKRAPEASQGQTVLFTNAQPVVESERHRIYNDVEESCLFIDEGSVVVESSDQRPRTAVYA